MGSLESGYSVQIAFVVLLGTLASEAKLSSFKIFVEIFLGQLGTVAVSTANELLESIKIKALQRKYTLRMSQFLNTKNLALRELSKWVNSPGSHSIICLS